MAARTIFAVSLLLLLAASGGAALPQPVSRRLLHAGHSDAASASDTAGSDTSFVEGSNSSSTATIAQLKQSLTGSSATTDLSEDDVNTLLQDVQGDSAASTAANTSLTADNIIDTYGDDEARTINDTAFSTAALAILACKADSNCQLAPEDADDDAGDGSSISWLKWTGAAVLFVEALIGLLIPLFLKMRLPIMNATFLSCLNCFAGGVFLTFGFMHLLPDAVSAVPDSVSDNFPMGYFFAALGFYMLFVLQRVVSPMLGGHGHHGHDAGACRTTGCCQPPPGLSTAPSGAALLPTTVNPAYAHTNGSSHLAQPMKSSSEVSSSSDSTPVECTNCGCDLDTNPEIANMAASKALAAPGKPYHGMTWRAWIAPIFMWAGICVHGVLEGLSLGLQHDKAGAVTVLVAMVSHKWVESVALSSILVKNGGGFKEVAICLLPFAACFFLGTGIGVGVGHDENPWVDIVLFGLIAGAFIFVGGYELIATEFSSERNLGKHKFRRAGLFVFVFAGFVLVALLQLVHGS